MINKYRQLFSHLNTARVRGVISPHKAVLLLGILEMVEFDLLRQNKVFLSDDLLNAYSYIWNRYVGQSDVYQRNISQPFWYMKSEPFWTLYHNGGGAVDEGERMPSESTLKEGYYCVLDKELYSLIQEASARAILRVTLISTYLVSPGDVQLSQKENNNIEHIRAKAKEIYLHMPDGSVLHHKVSVQTLIEAVQLVGPAKVATLNIICCGIPLVSKRLDSKYASDQEAIGGGYYIIKKNNTETKVQYLKTISKAFDLGWKVEMRTK